MSARLIFKNRYGRRLRDVIMPKILVLGEQPQFRTLLSESLWFDGHRVVSVADAAKLREHLGSTRPDLVLLDANLDRFGTMKLFQDLKQQFPDLAVMVYQCRNYGDVARIKGAQSLMPWKETRSLNRIYLVPKEPLSILSRWQSEFHIRYSLSQFCEAPVRIIAKSEFETVMTLHVNAANYL